MDSVNNNQFEVIPNTKAKRKLTTPSNNVYLNPALDLLANEDPMCNTAMEIVPKKRKRTKSCDITTFENTALDLGISKAAVNEFLARELQNVKRNTRNYDVCRLGSVEEPIYANMTDLNPQNLKKTFTLETLNVPQRLHGSLNDDTLMNVTNVRSNFSNFPSNLQVTVTGEVSHISSNMREFTKGMLNIPQDETLRAPFIQGRSTNEPVNKPQFLETTFNKESFLNVHPNLRDTDETLHLSEIRNNVFDSGVSDMEHKPLNTFNSEMQDISSISNITNVQTNITNQIFVNNPSNLSLSFIDRLALDSPNGSNQSIYFDDDLNESNIMEIKTITIITKKKKIPDKNNTNPFLNPNIADEVVVPTENPFLDVNETRAESEYNAEANILQNNIQTNEIMPRRLFAHDTNSTISTVNESNVENQYENIDGYRSESPIYENTDESLNKQSKILGCDVSQFSAIDIMNLNKISQGNTSNESNEAKKDFKHQILKASNKLSSKLFKTLKKTFKGEKDKPDPNITLNPYEVPRKPPKGKVVKDSGFENPALNLDISDDIEIEEIDGVEHTYETIKTLRNTRLNMNVTPLRERNYEAETSHNRTNTPGKKVRFDSTLNQEKIITGNSFDGDIQSPGFDSKIDKYHDELENCINERKFIQQNM
ncbi:uncharacterized protein LOC134750093 [Cydia strobilella]|uniref:uncharacterized protein LOC134750093 n=1 Tax=Cydia strobilella TaxID=1100964 RepID=UPI003005E8F1